MIFKRDPPKVVSIEPKLNRATKPMLDLIHDQPCMCTFLVDKKARTVRCQKCDRVWDAFDAMVHLSRDFSRYAANRDCIKREMHELEKKRDELRKEISNLKAKKRRAKERSVSEAASTLEHLASPALSREDA